MIPDELAHYQTIKILGQGITGTVKLIEHEITGDLSAVKIISKKGIDGAKQKDIMRKAKREIGLMHLCNHPNILQLQFITENQNYIYIFEDYAPNGSLFDIIPNIDVQTSLTYFRQLVYGIEYLHQIGICHRDLKPENILLDPNKDAIIADFGFASWMPDSIYHNNCGSLHYAAPEILKSEPYNGKPADIWSLGVIFFAMITVCIYLCFYFHLFQLHKIIFPFLL